MEKIKNLRKQRKLTMKQLGEIMGLSESTISLYENGKRQPDYDTLKRFADYFCVTVDYLLGRDDSYEGNSKNSIVVPVLGQVAAGVPIEAIEEILDYEELNPEEFNPNYEYFGLKIKGDSMIPKIQDGDVVIVRRQPDVENGEIAIVCVNGDSATCKQIKKHADGLSLLPFNSAYDVSFFTNKECIELPITIIGKVMELRRKF